ncbi:MAG: hypothetical protein BV459_00915 [Thermoplasmata archaeon M11B2D]|nr:MAG: hypothetical protein BV459_00915 [Thermoplasmata archaeon M11B2D]PNX53727.1 MAG: hypothetical protein BV458_02960 [Thermoplasmata archaeon M9B2D]
MCKKERFKTKNLSPGHMEYSLLYHIVIPFALSALVVILVTIIAEKYGTKTGGVIGTLPSTIIIAFLFIALDKGVQFATDAVVIVPAEMGINLVFLLLFALLSQKNTPIALLGSLLGWTALTVLLYYSSISSIIVSLSMFILCFFFTLLILDRKKKIPSQNSIQVHYTPLKLLGRSIIAGTVIAIAVTLSNVGTVLSGIFSVFPAIFLSTMIICMREHGARFTGAMAKGMIYGSPSVVSYAVGIYFLYPLVGVTLGTISSFLIGLIVTVILFTLRKKIR